MDLLIKQRNKIIITYVDTLFAICLDDGELVTYRPRFVTFSRLENNRESYFLLRRFYRLDGISLAGEGKAHFRPEIRLELRTGSVGIRSSKS